MAEAVAADQRPTEPQVRVLRGFTVSPNGDVQMFPVMYPALVTGLSPLQNDQEQMDRGGAGIYAVPTYPLMGPMSGIPPTTLTPFTYNVPTTVPNSSEAGQVGEEQGQVRQQERQQQQPGPQRVVAVRRFRIAIEIDLFLILKLAAVIFLFYQDGSRQKLFLLVFSASLIYLYQTGALAPLIQWMSRGMQRAVAPPQPPRPADGANNIPAAARQGIENAALAVDLGGFWSQILCHVQSILNLNCISGTRGSLVHAILAKPSQPCNVSPNRVVQILVEMKVSFLIVVIICILLFVTGGQPEPGVENENENQAANDGHQAVGNEQEPGAGNAPNGNRWWGIVKEIQMIIFGFITSFFFPGFHNID